MTDLLTTVPTVANGEFASDRTSPMERIGTKGVVPLVTGSHVGKTEGVTNPLRSLRWAGDPKLADAAENITRARTLFPRSSTIMDGYEATSRALSKARKPYGINMTLGLGNAAANVDSDHVELKDHYGHFDVVKFLTGSSISVDG